MKTFRLGPKPYYLLLYYTPINILFFEQNSCTYRYLSNSSVLIIYKFIGIIFFKYNFKPLETILRWFLNVICNQLIITIKYMYNSINFVDNTYNYISNIVLGINWTTIITHYKIFYIMLSNILKQCCWISKQNTILNSGHFNF